MKTLSLLLINLSLLLTTSILAQEQTGLVREQNSNKRTIAGVQVIFSDAVPTTSDDNGIFKLSFSGKKEGDLIFYEEIKKSGYEIVNEKELEILKIGRTNQLGVDVILAKTGVVDAAKKEYYDVSDDALIAGFNKEKRALQAQLQDKELEQEDFLDQFSTLQEQYDRQKQSLDNLATKFARINFDDVEPIYQEALELFKAGKVSEAITTLENANPAEQTKKIIAEEKRLTDAQKDLDAQKVELAAEKKKQIAAVRLLADMYNVNFDHEKAEAQYDQLLLLDSTNLEILREAAGFYREQHRYEKAKNISRKIIAHSETEEWQVANTYSNLGELHTTTGSLLNALKAYESCFESYEQLCAKNASSSFYKFNLGVSYERLASTHAALGHLDTALNFHIKSSNLRNELFHDYPYNVSFKNSLAISYGKLGETRAALGHLDTALMFYQQYNVLENELFHEYPYNVSFKNGLAISYTKLGETHAALGHLDNALMFYQQYNVLKKELFDNYPNNVEFKNGLAISYEKLGETHASLGHLDTALTFYIDETELFEELYQAYPNNVFFKNGLAISYSNLGGTHAALGHLDSALMFYQQFNVLGKELYDDYPNNVEFKNNLAIAYAKLGSIFIKNRDFETAKQHFIKYETIEIELLQASPENINFFNGVAISKTKLGMVYLGLNEKNKAIEYYQSSYTLFTELYNSSPKNISFQANYAQSMAVLGAIRYLTNQTDNLNMVKDAKRIFDSMPTEIVQSKYKERSELINKMLLPSVNLEEIIIEVSNFTL